MALIWFFAGVISTGLTLHALGGLDVSWEYEQHDKCENCGHEIKPRITRK